MREVLFDTLKLPAVKKTSKGTPSTAEVRFSVGQGTLAVGQGILAVGQGTLVVGQGTLVVGFKKPADIEPLISRFTDEISNSAL